MKILALESSAKAASAAVVENDCLLGQYWQCTALTHSRTLMSMAESLLQNMEMKLGDIDAFAVAKGPGSFTGIRIGVAAAKGLAWGADKPLYGVSTLEAMAWHHIGREDAIVCPVMDARRSQVYNALFRWEGPQLYRLTEDRAIGLDELIRDVKACSLPLLLVGDGGLLAEAALRDAGVRCILTPEPMRLQSAWGVAMAAARSEAQPAEDLVPTYLRLPQAERERLERIKREENK